MKKERNQNNRFYHLDHKTLESFATFSHMCLPWYLLFLPMKASAIFKMLREEETGSGGGGGGCLGKLPKAAPLEKDEREKVHLGRNGNQAVKSA